MKTPQRRQIAQATLTQEATVVLQLLQTAHDIVLDTVVQKLNLSHYRTSLTRGYVMRCVMLGHAAGVSYTVTQLERICSAVASPLTVRTTISVLVDGGWLLKQPHPTDGRAFLLIPTEQSREIVEEISRKVVEHLAAAMRTLSARE